MISIRSQLRSFSSEISLRWIYLELKCNWLLHCFGWKSCRIFAPYERVCQTVKKNFLPISVTTLQLYVGLKHIILCPLLFFRFCASTNILCWIWYFLYNHCSLERYYKDPMCCWKRVCKMTVDLFALTYYRGDVW